jgi:hypothetical protein
MLNQVQHDENERSLAGFPLSYIAAFWHCFHNDKTEGAGTMGYGINFLRNAGVLALAFAAPLTAAPAEPASKAASATTPVTIEYYYRIRWGAMDEFKALYAKNHQPVLDELKKQGFITAISATTPYNHMTGEERWDWRVTITYRSAEDAVGEGTGYTKTVEDFGAKLFPDLAKFKAEEARRFSLMDEHWDVIVIND